MSFYTEIKIIDEDPKESQHSKRIPKWLKDYDRKIRVNQQGLPNKNPRPSTHNNHSIQPKWFEELSQKRRMSDIGNLHLSEDFGRSPLFKSPNKIGNGGLNQRINQLDNQLNKSLLIEPNNQMSFKPFMNRDDVGGDDDDDDDPYLPSTNHFRSRENKSKPIRNEFKLSNSDDGNLHRFTSTFKSIENLNAMISTIEEECIIPEMPNGVKLALILLENWGDQHYIGLNGIEILDRFGQRPTIQQVLLQTANSEDPSAMESNELSKLIDQVHRTHDDAHIWQSRIDDQSLPIEIVFQFDKPTTIGLIRIWNYNKSRIHSYRGVRFAKFKLDDRTIFCGEIAKAQGDLSGSLANFGDTILFTTQDDVLEQIARHDTSFQELLLEQMN